MLLCFLFVYILSDRELLQRSEDARTKLPLTSGLDGTGLEASDSIIADHIPWPYKNLVLGK